MEIVSKFLEKYRSRILLLWAFVFLVHGEKLHSEIIGIDTEDLIHIQGDFYGGWLNTGRQGLVALKWLTASLKYRPYVAGWFTLVLFGLAVSAFFVVWDKQCGKKREQTWLSWIMGSLLVIAHPVITEQFYFTLQIAEICIGMLLTYYAAAMITRGVYSWSFILGWTAFALLSPVMACLAWTTKQRGALAKIIGAGIVLASVLSSVLLFDHLRVYDLVIDGLLLYLIFFKKVNRPET